MVSSQSKFVNDIASDYDSNTSLNVTLTMSDERAAKKLRKMIEVAIDDNDIDGYDLIVSMDNDTINLIIDCDEIR